MGTVVQRHYEPTTLNGASIRKHLSCDSKEDETSGAAKMCHVDLLVYSSAPQIHAPSQV